MSAPYDPGGSSPSPLTRPVRSRRRRTRGDSAVVPVASLTLGLFALLGCSWIPVVNVGALLIAPLAVILGNVGRRRHKADHRLMSWFGIVTGGLALVVSIAMLAAYMTAENGARS